MSHPIYHFRFSIFVPKPLNSRRKDDWIELNLTCVWQVKLAAIETVSIHYLLFGDSETIKITSRQCERLSSSWLNIDNMQLNHLSSIDCYSHSYCFSKLQKWTGWSYLTAMCSRNQNKSRDWLISRSVKLASCSTKCCSGNSMI